MACSPSTAKLALQLSTLAYIDENTDASQQQMIAAINAGLRGAGYPDWSVACGPRSQQYDVRRRKQRGRSICRKCRETDWSFWLDWVEDLDNFLPLTPYSNFGVPVGRM